MRRRCITEVGKVAGTGGVRLYVEAGKVVGRAGVRLYVDVLLKLVRRLVREVRDGW